MSVWRRRATSALAGAVAWLGAGVALAAPEPESTTQVLWPRFPRDVSESGRLIDKLMVIASLAVLLLFIAMVGWMLTSCIKHGRKHQAHYTKGDSPKAAIATMGFALCIFLVVDGTLWFNSAYDMHDTFWNFEKPDKDPNVVRIEVNAHQWAWDARYAGPDGKFGTADDIVTLNDIRVPIDRPVLFQLAAVDVIHSFYLPNLRVKQDVVPGTINRAWFVARHTGEFDLACAQHCGIHHYQMKGKLTVLPQRDFERWAKAMSDQGKIAYDPNDKAQNWGWAWERSED